MGPGQTSASGLVASRASAEVSMSQSLTSRRSLPGVLHDVHVQEIPECLGKGRKVPHGDGMWTGNRLLRQPSSQVLAPGQAEAGRPGVESGDYFFGYIPYQYVGHIPTSG